MPFSTCSSQPLAHSARRPTYRFALSFCRTSVSPTLSQDAMKRSSLVIATSRRPSCAPIPRREHKRLSAAEARNLGDVHSLTDARPSVSSCLVGEYGSADPLWVESGHSTRRGCWQPLAEWHLPSHIGSSAWTSTRACCAREVATPARQGVRHVLYSACAALPFVR